MITVGRRRAASSLEPPGEGVEAVGVDHQRASIAPSDLPRQLQRLVLAAEAGPEDAGVGPLEGREHASAEPGAEVAVGARAADRHHLRLACSKIGSRSAGTATVA